MRIHFFNMKVEGVTSTARVPELNWQVKAAVVFGKERSLGKL
jgi:hypothetical protein